MKPEDIVGSVRTELLQRFDSLENKSDILKSPELKKLFAHIPTLEPHERASFGQAINELSNELKSLVHATTADSHAKSPIDVTAPFDVNSVLPSLMPSENGTQHPMTTEIARLSDIFQRMGFSVESSPEIDDQYHVFESLNFPKNHPARDDWDTFMTEEKDADGDSFIAPPHTSTMQNRILKKYSSNLAAGEPIAVISPDRVFRNEDVDARHEHTFYQVEGVYVGKDVHAGMLVATLQSFLEEYYGTELKVRMNPYYFPFTEPSFEFALSCPFCGGNDAECKVCSGEGWIELLGCGMIHPNVLRAADLNPNDYTGFAFGCGVDRLVMMKYAIEDVRHFHSGKLNFMRQF